MQTFEHFYEKTCNVKPNELKPGDRVENINPDCKHAASKGKIVDVKKSKQSDKESNISGNVVRYKVTNKKDGKYSPGDELEKTEIQLRKIEEWVNQHDHELQ